MSSINQQLLLKANISDVYTKTQVDELLALKADEEDLQEVVTAMDDKADKEDTYTKDEIDLTVDDLQYQIDQKADDVDIEHIEKGIHEAKLKAIVKTNKDEIVVDASDTNTEVRELILDLDFKMDSISPLFIDVSIPVSSVQTPYLYEESTYSYQYDSITIYDPPTIRTEIIFNNVSRNWNPKQILEIKNNTYSYRYSFASVDIQLHNVKIYLYVSGGIVDIDEKQLMITISGTGLDAEGYSGVAIGKDNISMVDFFDMFKTYTDDDVEVIDVDTEDVEPTDIGPSLNVMGMFTSFTDGTPTITTT